MRAVNIHPPHPLAGAAVSSSSNDILPLAPFTIVRQQERGDAMTSGAQRHAASSRRAPEAALKPF
jgi:hypothetical protein